MELKEEDVLLLGALLHDIGKFAQRAIKEPTSHEEVGADIVRALLKGKVPDEQINEVADIVYEHMGSPASGKLVEIVHEADVLSAGERAKRTEGTTGEPRNERLVPVLYLLDKEEKCWQGLDMVTANRFSLKPLIPDKCIFPIEFADTRADRGEYYKQWCDFVKECEQLPTGSFDAFFLSLYHLLYKYTWCVPSAAFVDYPTISLFDHNRMTAAIAWCLYQCQNDNPGKPFLLIQGDLGGIQDFIYRLVSPDKAQTGMAKRLRGRSFYLSLLTESIARFIMWKLNLPEPNLIWVGGGGFLILAPNNKEHMDNLEDAIKETEAELLEIHRGQLSISIASLSAYKEDFKNNYGELTRSLHEKLANAKERKFSSQDKWPEIESDEGECIVCAAPMKKDEGKLMKNEDGTEEMVSICPDCQCHEDIGGALPESCYLLWTREDWNPPETEISEEPQNPPGEEKRNYAMIEILGQRWYLLKEVPPKDLPGSGILYRIRGMSFLEPAKEDQSLAMGFKFVASHVPNTFEEIAEKAEGPNYLAALRMDVDDMGYLLAKGIPKPFRTPSIYASISRSLDLFFSGYMNALIRESDNLYIVYAGGDDLLIVGAWNAVLDKALEINQGFCDYTNNPKLHLSGGIYIFKPKFPIGRAAEGAGEAEHEAKKRKTESADDQGKNALCVFNEVFKWKDAQEALEFAGKLKEYLEDKRISRSFVQTMLDIYRKDYKENRLIWVARVLYQLARNVSGGEKAKTPEERNKAQAETIGYLETNLVNCKPGQEKEMMKTAQLWASVVLLKTREKPQKPKEEER